MTVSLGIDEEVELVTFRCPPRDPRGIGLIELVTGSRPAEIRRIERRALRRVVVFPCSRSLVTPIAVRKEEPQPVLHNRAAQGGAHIEDIPDTGRGLEAAGPQRVVQVGALQVRVSVEAGGAAAEAIAALLGNQVDHRAVGICFRRYPTDREDGFLGGFRVQRVADVPGRMEDAHPVEIDVGANLSVVPVPTFPV